MAKRVMAMMFFDEWLCHFEMKGGMSATSLWDKEKNYGSTSRVNHDLLDKLNKVIQSREIWPIYTDMEEYKKLRDTKYN